MYKKMIGIFLFLSFIVPSLSFAGGECREDRKKFCGDVRLRGVKECMKEHFKDLSEPCKRKIEDKVEKKIEKKMNEQGK